MNAQPQPVATNISPQFDRRTLLRQAVGVAAGTLLASVVNSPQRAFAALAAPLSPADFKQQIRGAILSIPTPFTADLEVDHQGVERMIQRGLPYGIRIASLTSGNSQYPSLKYDEITKLTQTMIGAVGDLGIAVAATGDWDVERSLEYSRFAEKAGAHAVQVLKPIKADDEQAFKFYQEIARGTGLPVVLHGNFSDPLLERLSSVESIVALKEDISLEYYIHVQRKFGERFAIFEGGAEYAFLVAYPYGSRASYTTVGTFAPQITKRFWEAVDKDDLHEAYRLVDKYEHPVFDRWSHEFWRASLEHFGVAARYLRPPQTSFSQDQMKDVAKFYAELGLS